MSNSEPPADRFIEADAELCSTFANRLHDGPVQTLTAAGLRLGLLARQVPEDLTGQVRQLEELLASAQADLRREMHWLRTPEEVAGHLGRAIEALFDHQLPNDLRPEIQVADDRDDLPRPVAHLFYRVVQEHLGARSDWPTRVCVDRHANTHRLTLSDSPAHVLPARLQRWIDLLGGSVTRTATGDLVVEVPDPT